MCDVKSKYEGVRDSQLLHVRGDSECNYKIVPFFGAGTL